jgi:LPS export ABC transporter protein LptC
MRFSMSLVAISLLAAACGGNKAELPVAASGFQRIDADQFIVGFQQYITEAGRKKAELLGDTAYIYDDSSTAKVKKIHLTLYDDAGQFSARLQSDSGNVNSSTQAMIARGSVVLVTKDGSRIETQELHYDPDAHRIWSNVATTKRDQNGTMSGSGFEADDKFNNVRVTNARTTGGVSRISF